MNKMMKRIVSMMLAVVMCFGLVDVRAFAAEVEATINFVDANLTFVAIGPTVTIEDDQTEYPTEDLTAPNGYIIVGSKGSIENFSGEYFIDVVVEKAPTTKTIYINFWDEVNNKKATADDVEMTVAADAGNVNSSKLDVPAGYELIRTGDFAITADNFVYVAVKPVEAPKPEMVTVLINFYDEEAGKQADEVEISVFADEKTIGLDEVKANLPAGYELVNPTQTYAINGGYVYAAVKPVEAPKPEMVTVLINFYDEEAKKQVAETPVEIFPDEEYLGIDEIKAYLPAGYEVVSTTGEINGGYVYVAVKPVEVKPEMVTVLINFYDEAAKKQVAETPVEIFPEEVELGLGLDEIKANLPAGYEVVSTTGEINGGYVYVAVKPVEVKAEKQIFVKFVDEDGNHVYTAGKTIIVDADATYANTSLTEDQVPAGYEIAVKGDIPFGGEYGDEMAVVVRKTAPDAPATKQIYVVYNDEKGNFVWAAGKTLVVDADATYVNTSALEEIPAGYELALIGDLPFDGDMLYVTVRKVNEEKATKQIYVVFEDENGEFVEALGYTLVVDADATYANTSILNYVPENYEIAIVGDIAFEGEFNDMMYVTVREIEKEEVEDGDDEVVVEPEETKPSKKKTAKAIPDTGAMDYTGFVVMVMAAVVLFVVRKVKA